MTLKKLLRIREQVDIITDKLAKTESRAYYTSPQWGGAQIGSTERSDRTGKAIEELGKLKAQLHRATQALNIELERLDAEELGANLIYLTVKYGKTAKELAAITGMTPGQVKYAMDKYKW